MRHVITMTYESDSDINNNMLSASSIPHGNMESSGIGANMCNKHPDKTSVSIECTIYICALDKLYLPTSICILLHVCKRAHS